MTRVPRLEEFGARYLASRLEYYIEEEEFSDLIRESASRIQKRQETDSIELLDDVRYYLSERFRLRFEEAGLEEMMKEAEEGHRGVGADGQDTINSTPQANEVGEQREDSQDLPDKNQEPIHLIDQAQPPSHPPSHSPSSPAKELKPEQQMDGRIRTLDGEIAGDEFAGDAINYQILLGKIDGLLERLRLDA